MNVMTKLLNALAFANVGNQHEFNLQLRQIDQPSAAGQDPARYGSFSDLSDSASVAPVIRHVQGAM